MDFINFLFNVSIICLGCILKNIFQVDEFLFFIIVFWLYIITNAFVNDVHLNEKYIVYLLYVSIIYTFATYKINIVVFSTIIQLVCGVFINELNNYFEEDNAKHI